MLNIKELRMEKNVFQKDIAKALNCTTSCVSSWEKGLTQPSIENLTQLADFFGCSVDYLIGHSDADNVVYAATSSAPSLTSDEAELLDGFRQLTPAMKGRILGNLEGLLQASVLTTISGKRKA